MIQDGWWYIKCFTNIYHLGSPWSLGRWWLGGGGDDSDEDHND